MPSGFGVEFKEAMTDSGEWYASLSGFGECLPYFENKVEINKNVVDKWGIPVLHISADWFENELQLYEDIRVQAAEMLEACGIKNIQTSGTQNPPLREKEFTKWGQPGWGRIRRSLFSTNGTRRTTSKTFL